MAESRIHQILTDRMELIAATLEYVGAELESLGRLASTLGAVVAADWPPGEYDRDAQLFFRDRLQAEGDAAIGWYSWYAIRRGDGQSPSTLIGAAGYFGPPREESNVEIGFSILPAWRCHGYATEIAQALVENAFADRRVQRIVAHTTPDNQASCRVLEKAGFDRTDGGEPDTVRYEILREKAGRG